MYYCEHPKWAGLEFFNSIDPLRAFRRLTLRVPNRSEAEAAMQHNVGSACGTGGPNAQSSGSDPPESEGQNQNYVGALIWYANRCNNGVVLAIKLYMIKRWTR